ncbi:MAG: GDP-mannose 4,6-dehydratase, partial [Fibrobacterota bacterium]
MGSHWNGRTCLVTGAAGFGGSHLCSLLLSRGASVIGLDRWYPLSSYLAHTGDLSKIDRVEGDVRDEGLLRQLLERFDVDTVFHLAAQPIVPVSNQIPMETFSINATGTMAVLEAIRAT